MNINIEREILQKILELVNQGKIVEFSEDWGGNSITITVDGPHCHCGQPEGSFQQMVEEMYRVIVIGGGPRYFSDIRKETEKTKDSSKGRN